MLPLFVFENRTILYKVRQKKLIQNDESEKFRNFFKGQVFSGTRPIKSSKSVNIGPKCIIYSAFYRKQIAKLYSGILKTTGSLFFF